MSTRVIPTTTVKVDRVIAYILNIALMIPVIKNSFSWIGLGATAAILAVAFYDVVIKAGSMDPAVVKLPHLYFYDCCILVGLHAEAMVQYGLNTDNIVTVLAAMSKSILILLGAGVVAAYIAHSKDYSWLRCVAVALIGAYVILAMYSNGDLTGLEYQYNGDKLLYLYLYYVILWGILVELGRVVKAGSSKVNDRLGLVMAIVMLSLVVVEPEVTTSLAMSIPERAAAVTEPLLLTWPGALILCLILVVCSVVMYREDADNDRLGADSYVAAAMAINVLAIRWCEANALTDLQEYAVLLVVFLASYVAFRNDSRNQRSLRLNSMQYLIAEAVLMMFSIRAIGTGYWATLIVTAVFIALLYARAGHMSADGKWLWIGIVTCLVVEALAWLLGSVSLETLKEAGAAVDLDGIKVLVEIYAVAVLAIVGLNLPHPSGKVPARAYNIVICACVGVLCLVSAIAM